MFGTDIDIWEHSESLVRLGGTALLVITLIIISGKQELKLGREITIASLRAFVQLLLIASVILVIFQLDILLLTGTVLLGMICVASYFSGRRSAGLPDNLAVCFWAIFTGAASVLIVMTAIGAIPLEARYLLPLGGMVIGNSMNVTSLALDRFRGEVKNNRMSIEAYLALGATPKRSIRQNVLQSVRSSLIPNIDGINTLGIIWIPGLMSGMLIAGTDPYVAAVFQITISVMILGSSTISAVTGTTLMSRRMFTDSMQLVAID